MLRSALDQDAHPVGAWQGDPTVYVQVQRAPAGQSARRMLVEFSI
jgi:hypothetical protein